MICFASDNWAPVHPKVLEAIQAANSGPAAAYGNDEWTERGMQAIRNLLPASDGPDPAVFFVYNGTGANVLALRALVPPYGAVLCAESAHINRDEAGAVQAAGAGRLLTVPGKAGKICPGDIAFALEDKGIPHHSQPAAVSISQPTELGTVYSLREIQELVQFCRQNGLSLHVDGARLANALVSLDCTAAEMLKGIDALSFGGTKNGMMFGEAVVMWKAADTIPFHRKQITQLNSKMRYVGAQIAALLQDSLYLETARHANQQAGLMASLIHDAPELAGRVSLAWPVESNAVFLSMPANVAEKIMNNFSFYHWGSGVYRIMCSWDTSSDQVEAFVSALVKECE